MIYPKISTEEWIKQHPELSVVTKSCDFCGFEMKATIPFITEDYAGLEAPMCSCGKNRYTCSISVTRTEEEHKSWLEVLREED